MDRQLQLLQDSYRCGRSLTSWTNFSLSSPLPTLQVVPVTRMSWLFSRATALSTLPCLRLLTTTWAPLLPRACAAARPILGRRRTQTVANTVIFKSKLTISKVKQRLTRLWRQWWWLPSQQGCFETFFYGQQLDWSRDTWTHSWTSPVTREQFLLKTEAIQGKGQQQCTRSVRVTFLINIHWYIIKKVTKKHTAYVNNVYKTYNVAVKRYIFLKTFVRPWISWLFLGGSQVFRPGSLLSK